MAATTLPCLWDDSAMDGDYVKSRIIAPCTLQRSTDP